MNSEQVTSHAHDFPPRLINWFAWSLGAGAMALILRRLEFLQPLQETIIKYMQSNLLGDQFITVAPRAGYLAVYLVTLLCLTGIASYYPRPWKTLPLIIFFLLAVSALTPILMMWNVYFFGPSLLFSVMVCSLGAWLSALFIKDTVPAAVSCPEEGSFPEKE